jgi:hypothetical protein
VKSVRIKYPTRQAWFAEQAHIRVVVEQPTPNEVDLDHRELQQQRNALYGALVVESLEEFKRKFGI